MTLTFLGEGGPEMIDQQNANANADAGDAGNKGAGGGDGGAGGDSGSGGAGGNGNGDLQITDVDKQFLAQAKQVFGDDPLKGLQQISQQFNQYKELQPFIEDAQALKQNPGHTELLRYLRNGGKDVALFQELQTLEVDKVEPFEVLVRKTMYETGEPRDKVEEALRYEYKYGDQYATANKGEQMALELKMRRDGDSARNWLKEFQQKTMNPEPAGGSAPRRLSDAEVAAIMNNEWKPLLSKSPFALQYQKEVETFDKTKLPLTFGIENDPEIASAIEGRIQQLAAMGVRPANQEQANAILQDAKEWAIGKNFERVFQLFADALSRQYNGLIGEKFYGIPRQQQGDNGGGNTKKSGIQITHQDAQAIDQNPLDY